MVRTTPFHERTSALNETGLWEHWANSLVSVRYQMSEKFEYFAIRNAAGLFDTSPLYKYRFRGPDAERFLAGVLARDPRKCPVGKAQYTLWCDDRGFVIEDGVLLHVADGEYLLTAAEPNLAYLHGLVGRLDLSIEDETDAWGILSIQGPYARDIVTALAPAAAGLGYFDLIRTPAASVPGMVSRTGYTGDLGYEIWVPTDGALEVWDAVAKAVSQAVVDADAANLKSARAQVAQQQALIDKKQIRAPFAGRLGIRAIDLGQYLSPGTKLVALQALDPIYVDFSVPQSMLRQVSVGQEVAAGSDALPGEQFEGRISAIDAKVDTATRNVTVRATLRNPNHQLLPGMFAIVTIESGTAQRLLTLPQTAITFNPYGNTVFVIEAESKGADGKPKLVAQQRFVTTGATRGDQIAVLSGVKEGETVVSAGQLKLRNGVPVKIDNSVQPANNPAPQPKDE